MFKFLLNVNDIKGTFVEKRIDEVLSLGHDVTTVYKLKSTDKKYSKMDLFTPELQAHVKSELA